MDHEFFIEATLGPRDKYKQATCAKRNTTWHSKAQYTMSKKMYVKYIMFKIISRTRTSVIHHVSPHYSRELRTVLINFTKLKKTERKRCTLCFLP